MMNHRLTASILLSLLAAPCFWAATAAANPPAHPASASPGKSRKGGIPNRWKARKEPKKNRKVPSASC